MGSNQTRGWSRRDLALVHTGIRQTEFWYSSEEGLGSGDALSLSLTRVNLLVFIQLAVATIALRQKIHPEASGSNQLDRCVKGISTTPKFGWRLLCNVIVSWTNRWKDFETSGSARDEAEVRALFKASIQIRGSVYPLFWCIEALSFLQTPVSRGSNA